MATDTSGQQAVDFVWGNFPMQPNDDRAAAVTPANIGGSTGDYSWSATTRVAAGRLDAALSNHAVAEAGWAGYPSYTPGTGKFNITQAAGNGTTIRYESFNFLAAGDTVNITGVNGLNLSSATVATATRDYFTVTNSTVGNVININNGIVERSDALTAGDGAGIGYIIVPSVVGRTTALALDALLDAGYESANITTATAATNAASTITAVSRTGTTATITSTGAGAKYPVGTKITVASLVSPDTALNGTWTVTAVATDTVSFTTVTSGALSTTGLSVAGLTGVSGTIKTQSTAANAASVSTTATITITPFA
jgi:hypothetical protein